MAGVTYLRIVRYLPHSMVAHVLVLDKKNGSPQFMTTPPDEVNGGALSARTTSQFLEEFGVQIAINGDGFFPWWSRSPVDYYPHVGQAVTPNGFAASYGERYANGLQDVSLEPTLYISRRNELTFNRPPNKIYHAISGDRMLVQGGRIILVWMIPKLIRALQWGSIAMDALPIWWWWMAGSCFIAQAQPSLNWLNFCRNWVYSTP